MMPKARPPTARGKWKRKRPVCLRGILFYLVKELNDLLVDAKDALENDLPRIMFPRGNARAQPRLVQVFAEFGLDRIRQ